MARCLRDEVVRGPGSRPLSPGPYPRGAPEEDPLRLREGEQAWGMTLRSSGPEYVPLRVFRDGDLLDPGSDPLIALMGALADLNEGERVVARLLLRSLGPEWSLHHAEMAHGGHSTRTGQAATSPTPRKQGAPGGRAGGLPSWASGHLPPTRATGGCRPGRPGRRCSWDWEPLALLAVGGWAWGRWKKSRSRVFDPLLIREKVSRIAFDAEIRSLPFMPESTRAAACEELLEQVAAAYRHYDNPAGARLRVGKTVLPTHPTIDLHPSGPGLFGRRSVMGVREAACLWHPPGPRRRDPPGGPRRVEGASALGPKSQGGRPCRATPRRELPGGSTSPVTCSGGTTSTWPGPVWASPPSCTTWWPTR